MFKLVLLLTLLFQVITLKGVNCDALSEELPLTGDYIKPIVDEITHLLETFDELNAIGNKWIKSEAKKNEVEDSIAKYNGEWAIESALKNVLNGDLGLVLKSQAKHHAISTRLNKPFDFKNKKPLIVQYEVKFQNALECGGAYAKLIADEPKTRLEEFFDKTSYSIMFGPDKCGTEKKYHFIIRYKNPKTKEFEEKHAKASEISDSVFSDGRTHLYKLIVRPDNTFTMFIDNVKVNTGNLLTDMTPPISPPKEIVDKNDKKPSDWDDREKITDEEARKPDDWNEDEPKLVKDIYATMPIGWLEDEPAIVSDPNAVKPEDWDDETDGEWEAPKVDNPKCKSAPGCGKWETPMITNQNYRGKWTKPLIANPNYQGVWKPRMIPNPEYFEDSNPFENLLSFSSMGLELWSMTDQIYFDNFIIADEESVVEKFTKDTWSIKHELELRNIVKETESSSENSHEHDHGHDHEHSDEAELSEAEFPEEEEDMMKKTLDAGVHSEL